jgi:hypothetical protein
MKSHFCQSFWRAVFFSSDSICEVGLSFLTDDSLCVDVKNVKRLDLSILCVLAPLVYLCCFTISSVVILLGMLWFVIPTCKITLPLSHCLV